MSKWDEYVQRAKRTHGDKLDLSDIPEKFLPHFGTDTRIRVSEDRTGLVSVTTGWRPSLMLLKRRNSSGSWDLLSHTDEILAVKPRGARQYRAV